MLASALDKRAAGVPTYAVPEAAALLGVSPEHLYRLIRMGGFPALQMQAAGNAKARWSVPALAVEQLLTDAASAAGVLDVAEWTQAWRTAAPGAGAGR